MIQATDLRIGNYQMFGERICIVTALFKTHFICDLLDGVSIGNSLQNRFHPIPLTPDILEKCGFWNTDMDGEYIYNERGITRFYISPIGLVSFKIGDIVFSTVHFLHQLQNLYKALTNNELEIKL
jgi:hypothetical protein